MVGQILSNNNESAIRIFLKNSHSKHGLAGMDHLKSGDGPRVVAAFVLLTNQGFREGEEKEETVLVCFFLGLVALRRPGGGAGWFTTCSARSARCKPHLFFLLHAFGFGCCLLLLCRCQENISYFPYQKTR
jgi:hypothetical protein